MLRNLHIVLTVALLHAFLAPADAAPSFVDASVAKRSHTRISKLTCKQVRLSGGHAGEILEWTGRVNGAGIGLQGIFTSVCSPDGYSVAVRVAGPAPQLGAQVDVLGRVVEQNGKLHHVDALVVAPHAATARANETERHNAATGAAVTRRGNRYRQLAARGSHGLSRYGAVRWMKSFNKNLDDDSANALANTILAECARRRVDSRLVMSLFAAESRFDHTAISSVGAIGLGQLMPETAAEMGVKDSRDPHQNAVGAIKYIARLQGYWKDSPAQFQLTLASYNAGAGTVESFGGVPPYPETQTYVKRIMGYYSELRHID